MIGDLNDGRNRLAGLPAELRASLTEIAPSGDAYPCRATLRDGTIRDHVFVAEAHAYIKLWGVWPWEDPGKDEISITDVASLDDSPSRLPVQLAARLYEAGESMMGGCRFQLRLRDGRRFTCLTGNAVDFLDWPADVEPSDVIDVVPHSTERSDGTIRGSSYAWCLYWDDSARA